MGARKPEPRKGRETLRTNFNIGNEPGVFAVRDTSMGVTHSKAFGVTEELSNKSDAKYIGKTKDNGKTIYWYVDRRHAKGSERDRKK